MDEHLTEYEQARAVRIAENNLQMESMGIPLLVAQVVRSHKSNAAKKARTTRVDKSPTRWSRRVAGSKAELPWDLVHMHLAPGR